MESNFKLRVPDVQDYLRQADLDGWLIYDFFGLNRVARELVALGERLITRRWFYFLPREGEPTLLVHRIERATFPELPGQRRLYAGWQELQQNLKELLSGSRRVAMEYSPGSSVPTVSFVDAGTFEMVLQFVPEIVSSANLIQYFTCRLTEEQLESHKRAAAVLHAAQQQAFRFIEERLQADEPVNEYEVQQLIMKQIADAGMTSMSEAIVAVNENASDPHYAPDRQRHRAIRKGDCILIDLWCKEATAEAVYADITWVGFAGKNPPPKYVEIWETVREARDLAVQMLQENHAAGRITHGYEVDEVVRSYIAERGYGDYFFHRTGHSIDTDDHGKGVNIDSYETRDTREIVPGLLFSIEPGIYLPEFGVRTEIDVYFGHDGPEVHTPPQTDLILMDV